MPNRSFYKRRKLKSHLIYEIKMRNTPRVFLIFGAEGGTAPLAVRPARQLSIVDFATNNGMDQPIDITHNILLKQKTLDYYWIHPTIATQGSHIGTFSSAINFQKGAFTNLSFRLQRFYKLLLYEFR